MRFEIRVGTRYRGRGRNRVLDGGGLESKPSFWTVVGVEAWFLVWGQGRDSRLGRDWVSRQGLRSGFGTRIKIGSQDQGRRQDSG